ncbi:hypothetical protein [Georgenia sp. AZ-5]|uniref:hypothetical protein n=1 Tax=Georgenia sp. AZ-5 TaxID=3367526 RepID=UPI003754A1F1
MGSAVVDWLWVAVLLGFLGMILGIRGIHRYQAPADGAPGRVGAWLVVLGAAVIVLLGLAFLVWEAVGGLPEAGPAVVDVAWMVGFAAFVLGVILFAIGIIKGKVLPAGSAVLMLVGLLAAIAIDMATGAFFEDEPTTTEWGFFLGVPLFALGLCWAGYAVWKGRASGRSPEAGVR